MNVNCKEVESRLAAYVDGELDEAAKGQMFLHIANCLPCRSFFEATADMKLRAAREKRMATPSWLDKRVDEIVRRRTSPVPRSWGLQSIVRRRLSVTAPLAVVLALVFLLSGAGITLRWMAKRPEAKQVIEPVIYMKLPTIEVLGNATNRRSTVR